MANSTSIAKMRTAAVIQKMKEKRYDPLTALIDVAQDQRSSRELKVDIAKTLMKYAYPQLKHVEIDAQVNHGITVQVRQFMKPDTIKEEKDVKQITGQGTQLGTKVPEQQPEGLEWGSEDPGETVDVKAAHLPVGAGGHPDIIPDPVLPTKRKT